MEQANEGDGGRRESRQRNGHHDPGTARALGWLSVGLGAAQVLAPSTMSALTGTTSGGGRALQQVVGFRELATGIGLLTAEKPGRWLWARVAGDTMDLALLGTALVAPGTGKARVLASAGAVAGVTAADLSAAREATGDGYAGEARRAVTIRRPRMAVYEHWRDFRNLPGFMAHLESVEVIDERRSRWKVEGVGAAVEWEAEITEDRPGELIAWRSIEGTGVSHSGEVQFRDAPGDRGTEVVASLEYSLPLGKVGEVVATMLQREPGQLAGDDLRRFKQIMESGEVMRSDAQMEGTKRSLFLNERPAQPAGMEAQR